MPSLEVREFAEKINQLSFEDKQWLLQQLMQEIAISDNSDLNSSNRIVIFFSRQILICSQNSINPFSSKFLVGSSKINNSGLPAKAKAKNNLCSSPPDNFEAQLFSFNLRLTVLKISSVDKGLG
ncbi:hypothetical protein L2E68_08750 [Planktothrix agardhii 1029]|nr:hypothetical protein [Planktothrix agardhii 1029]MCF3620961.1 hypothetical protein [Planktothrix agardhii 1030]